MKALSIFLISLFIIFYECDNSFSNNSDEVTTDELIIGNESINSLKVIVIPSEPFLMVKRNIL
jgi:hypothetical protein